MRAALAHGRQLFLYSFDTLLALPVVLILHHLGVAGRSPVLLLLVVLLAAALQHPELQ